MYYVTISTVKNPEEQVLYYPGDDKCCIYATVLPMKVGQCGTFEFSVPSINPCYSQLIEWSIITIYRNEKEYWRGFISEVSVDFLGNASVYCLEDLAWLNTEPCPVESGNTTRAALLEKLISIYNNQNGIKGTIKVFELGAIYYGSTNQIHYEFNYDDNMLTAIRQVAGDDFVRVRRENGKRYIDILRLQDFSTENTQKIEFGYNLLDYTKELNTSYMLNAIKPYGAELETEVYEGLTARLEGDVLENADSIAKYGRISKNIIFDDVTDTETLQTQARLYLERNSQPRVSLELNALDMSELGTDSSELEIGDSIEVIAEPYGIHQRIRITELKLDLQDASKNTYTLSDSVRTGRTLTAQSIEAAQKVESIPEESADYARKNTMNLLRGANGGYVTYKFNESGQPIEIRITDAIEEAQSFKKWVWNENGLGYMERKDISEDFEPSDIAVALTMDGQILARTGFIGSDSSAWNIGEHSIYNGTKNINDEETVGMYIGTDGFLTVGTGTLGYPVFTRISGGQIYSNTRMQVGSLQAGSVNAGNGASGTFSFTGYIDGKQKAIGINVTNGIITAIT